MKLEIKKGKSLSVKQIKKWNKTRIEDWQENKPLSTKNRKKFAKDIFFILYDKNKEVLSSGRLRPIKIKFLGKTYSILGGGDLISEIKGKGYGKKIKKAQIKYAKEKKKTMIGFCTRKNTSFYKKCGLKIEKDSVERFVYPAPKGYKPKEGEEKYRDEDATYVNGKDKFMEEVLSHPKENVMIPVSHW